MDGGQSPCGGWIGEEAGTEHRVDQEAVAVELGHERGVGERHLPEPERFEVASLGEVIDELAQTAQVDRVLREASRPEDPQDDGEGLVEGELVLG